MKLPAQLVVRLSPLVEAVRGQPLLEPSLAITGQPDGLVQVTSEVGAFTFDPAGRVVSRDGAAVADFAAVQSIDVAAFPGGLGEPSWSVSLYLGVFKRITLGRTYDDGTASVLAARLARLIGCKVVALARHR